MNSLPLLVVDKKGIIGEAICQKLIGQGSLVVYVSQRKPKLDGVVFVPYANGSPEIPGYTYSHIFVVDNGTLTSDHLVEFSKKAEKDNAVLIFITSLSNASSFYKKMKGLLGKIKTVVTGDIIGNNTYPLIVYNSIKFGKIELANEGLSYAYPVFLEDVIDGIIDAAFDKNTKPSIFYLFPKHPPTELSLARIIQKANPMVQIDFAKRPKEEQEYQIPPNGKYLLPDNYPLKKKIRELNIESLMDRHFNTSTLLSINLFESEPQSRRPELVEWVNNNSININRNVKARRLFPFRTLLLVLFLLLIMPFVLTLILSLSGFLMLGSAKTAIENGNIANAQKSGRSAKLIFSLAKKSSIPLLLEGKLIGQEKNLDAVTKNIDLGSDLSQMAIHIASINPKNDFTKGANELKSAITILREIEAEGKLPSDVLAKTKSVDNLIKMIENTIDFIPNIFGLSGKKVYLVLFQNNMELRPGGGFIGSYGLLTFNAGKIADFSIADVYDADGQLKGHVEPPYPIRRHLGSAHWYLRDSNFDVDFAKGASSSALLLNAELGVAVDGVIGIDVSFVKSILEEVGPVFVADYKETVTSSNLYELTQSHAEKNFFAGSRQKKDFLRSLFSAMQLKLSAKNNLPYFKIAKSIDEAISQKHLLFAFSDKNLQDLFTVNKWSSVLWEVPVGTSSGSINDFLGINEANLGVNKANYFIKRKVHHNVRITENGNAAGEVAIDYKNTSNEWPGGDYVNYLRLILPLNTEISSISFDGVSQDIVSAITDPLIYEAKDFIAPLGLELEKYEESGKTIYGFLVNVKAGESKEIKIEYALSQKISLELQSFSYNLRIFKQPGIDSYPYSFSIAYPQSFKIISGSPSSSFEVAADKQLKIDFARRDAPGGASRREAPSGASQNN